MPKNAVLKAAFGFCVLFSLLVYPAVFSKRAEYSCKGAGVMDEFAREMQEIRLLKQRIRAEQGREKTVVISFAGDCTIGTDDNFQYKDSFPHRLEQAGNDYGYFLCGVLPVFEEDDLTLVNLESTFTVSKYRVPKKYNYRGDPSYTAILNMGSVEMVNISNNHIYDYGNQGYMDTLSALQQAGILFCGEKNIAFHTVKGVTIGCIGHTGWERNVRRDLERDIEYARSKAHIVVVSFHWGNDRANYPNSLQTSLGRFCIDKGADVVVGHHPHVIQGIERYKDRYIVYSLGNFCYGGSKNPSDKDTFIFQNTFTVKDGKVQSSRGNIIPCSISSVSHVNDYRPTILQGDEAERIMSRIYRYSSALEYGITK
jgi:poly-gamma-glutamate capsule biosynthesis protein CapA/YwtB (metallophosphatase superfamily)